MGAKPNIEQVIEHRNGWNDLFWLMAENNVTKYNEIKKLETSQFFIFLEKWKQMIDERIKQAKKQ